MREKEFSLSIKRRCSRAQSTRSPPQPAWVALEDESVHSHQVFSLCDPRARICLYVVSHRGAHSLPVPVMEIVSTYAVGFQTASQACEPLSPAASLPLLRTDKGCQLLWNMGSAMSSEESCGRQFSGTSIWVSLLHCIALCCRIAGSPITFSSSSFFF